MNDDTSTRGSDIAAVGHRIGAYAWIEERLFEQLGGWVPSTPQAMVKEFLHTESLYHGWHAELWRQRVPVLHDLATSFVEAPSKEVMAVIDDVASLATTEERLAAAYRVIVPRLVVEYELRLGARSAATGELAGGPVRRAMELVLHDERRAWRTGEALLQQLVSDPMVAARVAAVAGDLEARLVAAGGLLPNPV